MFGRMFGGGSNGANGAKPRHRVEILKDDPAKCGCDDQYRVVAKDAQGRIIRTYGSEIRGYQVAKNIKDLAERGSI